MSFDEDLKDTWSLVQIPPGFFSSSTISTFETFGPECHHILSIVSINMPENEIPSLPPLLHHNPIPSFPPFQLSTHNLSSFRQRKKKREPKRTPRTPTSENARKKKNKKSTHSMVYIFLLTHTQHNRRTRAKKKKKRMQTRVPPMISDKKNTR